ncbi:hypothetical protein [Porticoccus sp.]
MAQNRLAFLWYAEIGKHVGELTAEIRKECKLDIGVPILAESNEEFNRVWSVLQDRLIQSERLAAMEILQVTSLFTTKQMAEYLDQMDKTYTMQGVALPYPDDLYQAAMGRVKRNGH